jgi:hypothetical protein
MRWNCTIQQKILAADFTSIVTADTRAQRIEALFCCTSQKRGGYSSYNDVNLITFALTRPLQIMTQVAQMRRENT